MAVMLVAVVLQQELGVLATVVVVVVVVVVAVVVGDSCLFVYIYRLCQSILILS